MKLLRTARVTRGAATTVTLLPLPWRVVLEKGARPLMVTFAYGALILSVALRCGARSSIVVLRYGAVVFVD